MRRILYHIIAACVSVLASFACSRPLSMEKFVLNGDRGDDGMYRFELDFTDSLAIYDVYIYSRIDAPSSQLSGKNDIAMAAFWTAPDGEMYKDEFFFPIHEGRNSFFSSEYRFLYRKDAAPVIRGKWLLAIDVDQDESVPELNGLGVAYKGKR